MVDQSLKSYCEEGLGLWNGGRWIHITLSQARKVTLSLPSCAKLRSAAQDEKGISIHAFTHRGYSLVPKLRLSAIDTDSISRLQPYIKIMGPLAGCVYFPHYTFPPTNAPFFLFPPGRSPPRPLVLSSKPFSLPCPLWPHVGTISLLSR